MWLQSSDLKEETDSIITAAQYQALNMHSHHRNIIKQPTDSKYSMCHKAEEHIKCTVAGYITLVPSEYTDRHNKVAGYIHWMICKHMGLQVSDSSMNIYLKVS